MIKLLEYLFLLCSAVNIYSELSGNVVLMAASKPALMVLLMAFYERSVKHQLNKTHRRMFIALVFSWIGDVALMFVFVNDNMFLVGLGAFLVTHILYILSFREVETEGKPLLWKKWWVVVPLVVYIGVLLYLLVPAIVQSERHRPVLVPVIVYSLAIATMVVTAINRYGRVNLLSFVMVVLGALLFMVSDSIIAINSFYHPVAYAGFFIMVLYILGQYLIVKGVLAQFNLLPAD